MCITICLQVPENESSMSDIDEWERMMLNWTGYLIELIASLLC